MSDVKAINSAVTVNTLSVILLIIITVLDMKIIVAEFILNSILSISISLTNTL